jgi:pimeloyl-ACP methyl ester carboxylesterase
MSAVAPMPQSTVETWQIDSSLAPHEHIHVRARGPRGDTPIVIVHGFFQPASAILDVPNYSLQETLAAFGFRVVLFDLRGYGLSSRPPFMTQPPEASRPSLACMSDALADLGDVVEFVCRNEGVDHVDLLGYSWGTARSAGFAVAAPQRVRRLVLYAPVWRPASGAAAEAVDPERAGVLNPALGGYRVFAPGDLARQWDFEIGSRDTHAFRDTQVLQAAEHALLASDAGLQGRGYRAPLGPMLDALNVIQGTPLFDAERLDCDTLLIRGDCDRLSSTSDAAGLLCALRSTRKRLVTIGHGTHLLHLEHARRQLVDEVVGFLAGSSDASRPAHPFPRRQLS